MTISLHIALALMSCTAGMSIGGWLGLFFPSGRVIALVLVSTCAIVTAGTATLEYLFNRTGSDYMLAGYAGMWLSAFVPMIIASWALRSVFT